MSRAAPPRRGAAVAARPPPLTSLPPLSASVRAATDGVSSLSFSPASNWLTATSWDNQVRVWDVQANGQAIPKAAVTLEKPPLCSAWAPDGSAVFAGGCSNGVAMWNLATNQQQQVAQHAAPVRHCAYLPALSLLVTGSWDKSLKYWDLRAAAPAHTQQLAERVYAMDAAGQLLVVGTADRAITVFNLQAPQTPYKALASPLKYQTRCVACFPDAAGYLVGSAEGRVAVHHVEDAAQPKNFTFKCHRDGADVFAVNAMAFHPQVRPGRLRGAARSRAARRRAAAPPLI